MAEQGRVLDVYESDPGYFDNGSHTPSLPAIRRWCGAFGVSDAAADVTMLLEKPHSDVGFEFERHRELLRLLRLSTDAAMLGYSYVRNGELHGVAPGAIVRAAGGAPAIPAPIARSPATSTGVNAAVPAGQSEADKAREALRVAVAALVLNEIQLPAGFEAVAGEGTANGFVVLARVQRYISRNDLIDWGHGAVGVRADNGWRTFSARRSFRIRSSHQRLPSDSARGRR